MLCSLSFPARGTVWRILYLREVECCTGGRESLEQALSPYNPAHWLLSASWEHPPATMTPCHEGCYPSFSCEPKWSLPHIAFVRDVVEAATEKVIPGGRGQGEGWGRRQGEERELGGGEAARGVFFYTVRAPTHLLVPSSLPYKFSLPGETAEWNGSGVCHEAWWPSSIPKSYTVKGEWLQTSMLPH